MNKILNWIMAAELLAVSSMASAAFFEMIEKAAAITR